MTDVIRRLSGGLIVSCQAPDGSPLRDPATMALMARAAELGGAVGIRANGVDDVRMIRAITSLPIIALSKVDGGPRPFITPRVELARALVEAGADVIASDATVEAAGEGLAGFASIRAGIDVPVMADVSTLDEGLCAIEHGADVVGTTLSGYTPYTRVDAATGPDLDLVDWLATAGVTVFAEGRYRAPSDVSAALAAGASSVVVGGAITNPVETTGRFAAAWDQR